MHTEDDTFDRLCKSPFAEVCSEVAIANLKGLTNIPHQPVDAILKRHGWTQVEYEIALYHRIHNAQGM